MIERGLRGQLRHRAGGHQLAAAHPGPGTQVDHVVGAANGVLVVLDHHQRVAVGGELGERIEQHRIVARMQPDGGLIQHVAHALQVRAELRGEADALRLAARERGGGAVELEVA